MWARLAVLTAVAAAALSTASAMAATPAGTALLASATITYQCMPADQDEVLFRLASHFPHPMFPFMVCTHAEAIGFGAVRADFEEPSYESA